MYPEMGFLDIMVVVFLILEGCAIPRQKPLLLWSSNVLIAGNYFPFGERRCPRQAIGLPELAPDSGTPRDHMAGISHNEQIIIGNIWS